MPIEGLDPVIHQPARLEIMAYLYKNRQAAFTEIRDTLRLTAGNLQQHGEKLKEVGYVEIGKVLVGIFEVRWRITPAGDAAFEAYVESMRRLVAEVAPRDAPAPPER